MQKLLLVYPVIRPKTRSHFLAFHLAALSIGYTVWPGITHVFRAPIWRALTGHRQLVMRCQPSASQRPVTGLAKQPIAFLNSWMFYLWNSFCSNRVYFSFIFFLFKNSPYSSVSLSIEWGLLEKYLGSRVSRIKRKNIACRT